MNKLGNQFIGLLNCGTSCAHMGGCCDEEDGDES